VATDVGGVGDVIADDTVGRKVPARNVQALAHAILELFSNEQGRRSMSDASRNRVISTFDVETCYRRTTALYREVA
jgi:glycosyltransferase involved in cell wall biosynthesis